MTQVPTPGQPQNTEPPGVPPDWNVVGQALQEWIAGDVRDAPKRIFLVAKFLLGVSVGSIGVIISIYKFVEQTWGSLEFVILVALLASAASALWLAIPSIVSLTGTTNLVHQHNRIIKRARTYTSLWAAAWLLAVSLLAASLICPTHKQNPTEYGHSLERESHALCNPSKVNGRTPVDDLDHRSPADVRRSGFE